MKTENKNEVLLEVITEENSRRFVIPYTEWVIIKEWYCDASSMNDYYLTLDNNDECYAIIRLDKKISEVRVWELTRTSTLHKNINYILLSAIPRGMKFMTALLFSLIIWAAFGLFALIKGAELDSQFVTDIIRLTSVIFVIFLLLNIEFIVIKIVQVLRNRYRAFAAENEGAFTGTLAFNFIMLFIFAVIGPGNIIAILKKLWESIGFHF